MMKDWTPLGALILVLGAICGMFVLFALVGGN